MYVVGLIVFGLLQNFAGPRLQYMTKSLILYSSLGLGLGIRAKDETETNVCLRITKPRVKE